MNRRQVMWLLLLIIIVGVAIRSYQLTARSLWFDEAFSWRLIQFPWPEMMTRIAADVHPPLYYILLRGWGNIFGTSLVALRSFSIFLAGATIAAAYLFAASAWRSRAVGLLAAALLALSGWQAAFAWEARMYSLGTFLAIGSSWLLLKAVRRNPQRLWWWLAYAVMAAAFIYTHYFALLTVLGQGIFVVTILIAQTRWRLGEMMQARLSWYALSAAGAVVLLLAPWLPTFWRQNSQVQAAFWVPPIGGWSIPDTFYRMFFPTASLPIHQWPAAGLTILPLAVVVVLWLWLAFDGGRARRREGRVNNPICQANWLVLLCGAVPFLLSVVISFVGQSLYQDRFLVFANIFIFIGLAHLLLRLPWASWRRLAIVAVLLFFVAAYVRYWQELDIPRKPGAQAAARQVFSQINPNERLLVSSPFVFFAIDHYAREEYGSKVIPKIYSEAGEFPHFAGGPIFTEDDFMTPQNVAEVSDKVLWVVDTTGFGGSKAALSPEWRLAQEWSYPEVFVYQGEIIVRKYAR